MLREVNLCLVNDCNANCIYCPRKDYKASVKFMPILLVEKIVKELKSSDFEERHDVQLCVVGENGESTLHPEFINILRIIKSAGFPIWLFSNFSKIKEKDLKIILDEELVSCFHVNVDGLTAESYKAVKGIEFTSRDNIFKLLEMRGSKQIALKMHVITMENYIRAVKLHKAWPHKVPKNTDFFSGEAEKIKAFWQKFLSPIDYIGIDDCIAWAEKKYLKTEVNLKDYDCPNIQRVEQCAYIAPNGIWYACCFDMGNVLALGNVNENTIDEIYKGKKRSTLIDQLKNRRFKEIGGPCLRVDCCHVKK